MSTAQVTLEVQLVVCHAPLVARPGDVLMVHHGVCLGVQPKAGPKVAPPAPAPVYVNEPGELLPAKAVRHRTPDLTLEQQRRSLLTVFGTEPMTRVRARALWTAGHALNVSHISRLIITLVERGDLLQVSGDGMSAKFALPQAPVSTFSNAVNTALSNGADGGAR